MLRSHRATAQRLISLLVIAALAAPSSVAAAGNGGAGAARPAASERGVVKNPDRQVGKRGEVNGRELAGKPSKARPQVDLPRLRMAPPRAGSAPLGPNAPIGVDYTGPLPVPSTPSGNPVLTPPPPIAGMEYTGVSPFEFQPPDPWIAAGPDHIVTSVNRAIRVSNRTGGTLNQYSLDEFFLLPEDPVTSSFDPRVIYDSRHDRWLATEVSFDCSPDGVAVVGHGFIDFAVSHTGDPLGDWTVYYLQFDDEVPDYPMAGTSTDKVAISGNRFGLISTGPGTCTIDGTQYFGSEVDVLDWAQLAAHAVVNVSSNQLPDDAVVRPALQVPATSSTIYGVAARFKNGSTPLPDLNVDYITITGNVPGDSIDITRTDLSTGAPGQVAPFLESVPAPRQPADGNDSLILNAVDGRPTDALWQDGRLIWVSTYECLPAGDPTPRDCIRVTEYDTTTPQVRQDFLLGEFGRDYFHGGIGLSMNGALHVTHTRSSSADAPATYGVYQLPGDATNAVSAEELMIQPDGPYRIGERWGDYTGVAQDPQDPDVVWQVNEVAASETPGGGPLDGRWITKWSRLSTAKGNTFHPISPQRVLDTRSNIGLNFRFQHGVARSWQVANTPLIPANAVAVTGNVAIVGQTGPGHVAITPRPTNTPVSSSINFPLGDVRANNVTSPLGPDGKLSAVYISSPGKFTHIVFDVTGYFTRDDTGFRYNPLTPGRLFDTRDGGAANRLQRDVPKEFQVHGVAGVPAGAVAITGNLAVTGQTAAGHISITPTADPNPPTATMNFPFGDTRSNGQTMIVPPSGTIWAVFKSSTAGARTHLIMDVTGYYAAGPAGLRYFALNPGRLMDTRTGVGLLGKFNANTSRSLNAAGRVGVPADADAITGSLTVTQANKAGHLAVTPDPVINPPTATLNFPAGDTRANGVTERVSPTTGKLSIYFKSASGGTVHVILDVSGYFN